jgi:hypothetical protein
MLFKSVSLVLNRKTTLRLISLALISLVAMTAITAASSSIPEKKIKNEISKNWESLFTKSYLELFTLCGSFNVGTAKNPDETLISNALMNYSAAKYVDPCAELKEWAETDQPNLNPATSYSRYWFGTNSIVRILTTVFNLNLVSIGFFLLFAFGFLLHFFTLATASNSKIIAILGVTILVLLIHPLQLAMSPTTYSTAFIISCFLGYYFFKGVYFLKSNGTILLFVGGMWTNFLDLTITTAFMLPLIVIYPWLVAKIRENSPNPKFIAQQFIVYFLYWNTGYAFSWISKWSLAWLFGDRSTVWSILKGQAEYRINGEVPDGFNTGALDIIRGNLQYFWDVSSSPVLVASGLVIIVGLTGIAIGNPKSLKLLMPVSLVPLAPITYFSTFQNHSSLHPFIVFRSLALVVSVLFTIALVSIFSLAKSKGIYSKGD